METYNNCKTAHTGLYKPHTIYLNDSYGISIVYWKRDPKTINDIVAIAYDVYGNKYDIYETQLQKFPDDYSPSPYLFLECTAYWNELCDMYPN